MPVCQNNLIVFGNALFKRPLVRRSRFLPDPSFGRPSSLVFRPLLFSRPLVTLFPELALIVFLLAPFLRPLLHFSVPSLSAPSPSPRHASPHLSVPRRLSATLHATPLRAFSLRASPFISRSGPSRRPALPRSLSNPIIRLFQTDKRGKRQISGKKRPEKFFREECDEEL